MIAWFTKAQGDDLDDTLERAAQQDLTELCDRHLPVLSDTAIALFPIWNEGNAVWSERLAAIGYPELPTRHAGWVLTARELPTSGGHSDGRSPTPPSGGVHRSGEGQEPHRQGHPGGQPRAFVEERASGS
jgi:hypothetical protein